MTCRHVDIAPGVTAIVCGRSLRRATCQHCGAPAGLLCDYPTTAGGTCDRRICSRCACEVGPNRHYCPKHAAFADTVPVQGSLFADPP
jgi:hypothetical protein